MIRIAGLTYLFLTLFTSPFFGQTAHQHLLEGDKDYEASRYKDAEQHYKLANDLSKNKTNSAYNLGNALYKQGKWEEAEKQFGVSAEAGRHPNDRADALYNQGNALLRQQKYKEAIKSFESSLRLRPGYPDAKVNLQLAKKQLKEQEKQEQQKKKDQENKDQNQQDQANNDQNQNQQDQQNSSKPQQDPNQQQQPAQPNQGQEQPNQNQSGQNGKMSAADARRLLENTIQAEDQKNARKYRAAQPQNAPKSKKDW